MKTFPKYLIAIGFAAAIALGAWQGRRVQHLRESEQFYRWILAQATQSSLFAEDTAESDQQKADIVLYKDIVDTADAFIPDDLPLFLEEKDPTGETVRKLTAVARDEAYSDRVYDLAAGDVLAKQREDFLAQLRQKKVSTVASEFDPNAVYGEGIGVSIGNIFFGFRKVAANFVWLQVDKYWHQGMEQRMIPLMRTCTTLDPTFVDAFLLGAWHLAYNMTAKMPDTPEPLKVWNEKYKARVGDKETYYHIAIDFLKDGIRKNPRNYHVYFDLGYGIYNVKMKDYENAVKYLEEAVRQRHDVWVPRMLNVSLEQAGFYDRALAGWEDYLAKNPTNVSAPRFIMRNKGMIKETQAEEAAKRALAATDPAVAAAAREEADKLRAEAMQVWNEMNAGEEDTFALGRIMRMKAIKLLEEQRYLEAVAVLENTRWKSNDLWNEATDMMIDAKTKGNIPLSLSEKKYVLRKEEAAKYEQQAKAAQQQ